MVICSIAPNNWQFPTVFVWYMLRYILAHVHYATILTYSIGGKTKKESKLYIFFALNKNLKTIFVLGNVQPVSWMKLINLLWYYVKFQRLNECTSLAVFLAELKAILVSFKLKIFLIFRIVNLLPYIIAYKPIHTLSDPLSDPLQIKETARPSY